VPDTPTRCTFSDLAGDLHVAGEIDAHSAPQLSDELASRSQTDDLRVDLSEVSFMDSSGLRVLIDAHRKAESAGGRLVVTSPSSAVSRLIEISGLADHLNVEP
jgi:anti-sigma B factor antagonist